MSIVFALGRHTAALASSALLLVALAGAGAPAARWLGSPSGPWLVRWLFILVTGAGAAALLALGLGLAGLFQPGLLVAAVILGAAAGIARLRVPAERPDPGPAASLLMIAALAVSLPVALLPETAQDCLIYHLAAPEQFLIAHRIGADRFGLTFKLPLPGELLFAWSVIVRHDAAARVLPMAAGLLAAAAILPLAGLGARSRAGWMAVALFLASARVLFDLKIAKPDLLGLAAFAASLLAADRRRMGLAWAYLGLAAAFKLTFVLAAPAVPLWICLVRGEPLRRAGRGLGMIWVAAIPLLPWWIKNWWLTGNPLFFMLAGLFPTLGWLPASSEIFRDHYVEAFAPPGTGTWAGAAAYALGRLVTSAPGLALAAVLAFLPGARAPGRRLLALGLVLEVVFIRIGRMERFAVPADFLVAVAAAFAAPAFLEALVPRLHRIATALLALAGAIPLAAAAAGLAVRHPLPCLLGAEPPTAYLARATGELAAIQAAVRTARPRVLLLASEQRAYRFGCRVILSAAVGPPPLGWTLAREARGPDELAKRVRQLGVTHVAYNFVTAGFQRDIHAWFPWDDRMVRMYAETVRTRFRIVRAPGQSDHPNGGFYLYEILPGPGPAQGPVFYLPGAEGIMDGVWQAEGKRDSDLAIRELDRLSALLPDLLWVRNQFASYAFSQRRFATALQLSRPGCLAGMVDDENWSVYAASALAVSRRAEGLAALRRAAELYPERRAGISRALEALARGYGKVSVR